MDGRRRQWVPLSVDVARSRTGHNLQQKFGRDGLLVWMCLLAASKKSANQGWFEYVSEADGWQRLGIEDPPKHFTLDEFFAYTGQLKQTRKRRVGQRQQTEIRAWEDWNHMVQRQMEADRKSRKRAQKTRDSTGDNKPPFGGTDSDLDIDSEKEAVARRRAENQKQAEEFLAVLKKQTGGQA